MREIRTSGSEGREAQSCAFLTPIIIREDQKSQDVSDVPTGILREM
jgi:hypothetical protein